MFVIVGGGRWGRVFLKVLVNCFDKLTSIYWVTVYCYDCNLSWLKENQLNSAVKLVKKFNQAAQHNNSVCFIVNQANKHFETAVKYLNQGFNIYVEKPATLNLEQTKQLEKIAFIKKRKITVSLPYLHTKYLPFFKENIPFRSNNIQAINIIWKDNVERRYGLIKNYDISLPLLLDVFPHVWSILKSIFPNDAIKLLNVQLINGGSVLILFGLVGKKKIYIKMGRNTQSRERILAVINSKNEKYHIDFSTEPGLIYYNDLPYKYQLKHKCNHIFLQLENFLKAISNDVLFDVNFKEWKACITIIEPFVNKVINLQKKLVVASIIANYKHTKDHYYAMAENLACILYNTGSIDNFYKQETITLMVKKILNCLLINKYNPQNSCAELSNELWGKLNKNLFFQTLLQDIHKFIDSYSMGNFKNGKKHD